jgi:protein ImuB
LLEPLAFILNRLIEQLCARLSARALATQKMQLKFELDPCFNLDHDTSIPRKDVPPQSRTCSEPVEGDRVFPGKADMDSTNHHPRSTIYFTRTLRLPVPMLDPKIFLKLLQLDLRANPPGAPITKIWMSAEPARLRPGQAGLFIPPSPEPEKLELTMARISGIVGQGNVGAVELLDTHRPGEAPTKIPSLRRRASYSPSAAPLR